MSKPILLFLTIAAIALLPTRALDIRIDFENNETPPTGNWNIVDTADGSDANDLIDFDTGSGTGIGLSMTGLSTSGSTGNDDGRTEFPSWSSAVINSDRLFMSENSSGSMTISGLNPALTYTVQLVSSYDGDLGSGKHYGTYILNDDSTAGYVTPTNGLSGTNGHAGLGDRLDPNSDGVAFWNANIETSGASSEEYAREGWIRWEDAVPTASGELTIDYTTPDESLARVAFNSMNITAIPEPSTLAMLGIGLGAAGLAGLRRRCSGFSRPCMWNAPVWPGRFL